jgi:hypothetical protein
MGQVDDPASAQRDPENEAWIARRMRMRTRLDVVLAALVMLFACALAAVPIRNSDIWLHLALGRHLVTGTSSDGTDVFAHTANESEGPGPGWLFDLVCYGVYTTFGSPGLGILKALIVALLGAAIMAAGWRGPVGWVPVTFTTLALLAIIPWMYLRPVLFSLLFLAMTLAYLERRTASATEGASGGSWISFWPLYVLLALWVNTDSWFLLGPFVVTCYWIGGLLPIGGMKRARVPFLAVIAGLLVCLANPQLHHAFRLPDGLAFPLDYPLLADDPIFRDRFLSPLDWIDHQANASPGVAGLAPALLVATGLLALVLNRAGRHGPRLLVCAILTLLSLYQARNIPFLAVALGALVPRALQEFSTACFADRPGTELRLRQAVTGRFATVVLGLALIAVAWLGRLEPGRPQPRGLGIETDPSLVRAAEQMAAWRRAGKIGAKSLGLNYAPDIANYFAWFCPEEKGFFDSRLEANEEVLSDFDTVRYGLTGMRPASPPRTISQWPRHLLKLIGMELKMPIDPRRPLVADWRGVLRRRGVDHVILADRDPQRVQAVLRHVFSAIPPWEWQVLFQEGRVVVLGWRDLRGTPAARWHGRDLEKDGLHPTNAEKAPPAPTNLSLAASPWWQLLVPPVDKPSLDRDEAAVRMMMFEALRGRTEFVLFEEWQAILATTAVGQVAAGDLSGAALRFLWLPWGRGPGPASAAPVLPFSERLLAAYRFQRDEAPPGQLWAAIRACRRALAANPHDAEAYLLLGQLYCRLAWNTSERSWGGRLPAMGQLRRQQAIGALRHALRIDPELDQAHGLLVKLYQELNIVDRARQHLQEYQKFQRERGPHAGESQGQFAERIEQLGVEAAQFEREEFDREKSFAQRQAGLSRANQARLARTLGLLDKARDMLVGADSETKGDERQVALELLLWVGGAEEGRESLKPEDQDRLGDFEYHWLSARLDLVAGDYAGAEAHLSRLMVRSALVAELGARPVDLEIGLSLVIGRSVLYGLVQAVVPHSGLSFAALEPQMRVQQLAATMERTAEFSIVQGAVALERGDAERAERSFRQAMALLGTSNATMSAAAHLGMRPIASYYLRLLAGNAAGRESRGLLTQPAKGGF